MDLKQPDLLATKRSRKLYSGAVILIMGAAITLSACNTSAPVASPNAPAVTTPAAGDTGTAEAAETPTMEAAPTVAAAEEVTGTEGTTGTGAAGAGAVGTPTVEGAEEITGTEGTTGTGAAGAGAAATPTVAAGEEMTDTQGMGQTPAAGGAGLGVQGAGDQYVRASTLLDYSFENIDGEVSGDIEDLMVDLRNGRILFASIEYGGVLDLGDKDIVVPLSAFVINSEGGLVLNFNENELEQYPEVDPDNWPDLNDPTWDDEVNNFWNSIGIQTNQDLSEASSTIGWISDILGNQVLDAGFGAGGVLDVLVNLGTGQARYVLVDYGAGLGAGDNAGAYVLPMSAFDMTNREGGLTLSSNVTPDVIEGAPRFDPARYEGDQGIDATFGEEADTWWNEHGFDLDLNNDGD